MRIFLFSFWIVQKKVQYFIKKVIMCDFFRYKGDPSDVIPEKSVG